MPKSIRQTITVEDYFKGYPESRELFEHLLGLAKNIGTIRINITISQVALYHDKPFVRVWVPGKYLRCKSAPLVLSLSFPFRDVSSRWKEIVEPAPGRFTHHLEVYSKEDIDLEVLQWLREAWTAAG